MRLLGGLVSLKMIDDVLDTVGLCRRSEASSLGSFVTGIGLGLIGGAAVGMLLTPYKGSEAREKLVRASGDLASTVSTKVGQLTRGVSGDHAELGSAHHSIVGDYQQNSRVGL